jgi:hypothetical protein
VRASARVGGAVHHRVASAARQQRQLPRGRGRGVRRETAREARGGARAGARWRGAAGAVGARRAGSAAGRGGARRAGPPRRRGAGRARGGGTLPVRRAEGARGALPRRAANAKGAGRAHGAGERAKREEARARAAPAEGEERAIHVHNASGPRKVGARARAVSVHDCRQVEGDVNGPRHGGYCCRRTTGVSRRARRDHRADLSRLVATGARLRGDEKGAPAARERHPLGPVKLRGGEGGALCPSRNACACQRAHGSKRGPRGK